MQRELGCDVGGNDGEVPRPVERAEGREDSQERRIDGRSGICGEEAGDDLVEEEATPMDLEDDVVTDDRPEVGRSPTNRGKEPAIYNDARQERHRHLVTAGDGEQQSGIEILNASRAEIVNEQGDGVGGEEEPPAVRGNEDDAEIGSSTSGDDGRIRIRIFGDHFSTDDEPGEKGTVGRKRMGREDKDLGTPPDDGPIVGKSRNATSMFERHYVCLHLCHHPPREESGKSGTRRWSSQQPDFQLTGQ